MNNRYFPFGQVLTKVHQMETSPNKEVFVIGVYASAVHAKWIDCKGKIKVQALAVASEPEIFWKGEGVEDIISSIKIPNELGRLEPANDNLNGPSGKALDNLFLTPLNFNRGKAWLCDLLPESRQNLGQLAVLKKYYTEEIIKKFNLSNANVPVFDEREMMNNSTERHLEILAELEASGAKTIILLGDLPIKWFLHYFDKRTKLSQFGDSLETYGQRHNIQINGVMYSVIPLCHPRNAARLGAHSAKWADLHDKWVDAKKSEKSSF